MTDYQRKVRPIYLLAIAVVFGEFLAMAFGGLSAVLTSSVGSQPPPGFEILGVVMAGFGFAVVAAGFGALAWKPYWWSKLVLLPVGFSWVMFSVAAWLGDVPFATSWFAWCGGLALWGLALAHQILDFALPRAGRA